jgi:putative membrane protein
VQALCLWRRLGSPAGMPRAERSAMMREQGFRRVFHTRWTCATAFLVAAVFASGCGEEARTPKVASFDIIGTAAAQQADRVVPPAAMAGTMAPVDEAFALFMASSSLAEIEGARLVLKSTKNAELVEFAEKLIRDHTRMRDELRRIVAPHGLKLPATPTGRHADMVTKLAGVAAPDGDEAFIRRFGIDAHKEAITLVERHASAGKDAQLKRYAEQALATLREHLSAAHKLAYATAR